ncbi:hypothetical protein L3Q67_10730 [Saccharothrix sp. AJ9571]|nr:hypothetical protein L3Q67_10730 [Saccharothrix sp. AJ9571]
MTDESRGIGGAVGPPWSVDVLADLHAGVLDEREAAELWPLVRADAEASAIIEALESTTADLAALGDADVDPMPAEFAARLDAALAEEMARSAGNAGPAVAEPMAPPVAPVVGIDVARRKRRAKIAGWGAGVVGIAAAAIAAIAIAVPGGSGDSTGQPPAAQPPPGLGSNEPPLALQQDNIPIGEIIGSTGKTDYGPLGTQDRVDQCLTEQGFDPAVKPAGIRGVTVDGQPATMVILTPGVIGQFQLVALTPDCQKLMDKTVGGK